MTTTPQFQNSDRRYASDARGPRTDAALPPIEHYYQSPTLRGSCGTPVKFRRPSFFRISNDYFTEEAPRVFAVDAGIFSALILTALLPIVNGVQAVAMLIHSISVF